ncbi:MAG: undecaprenyl/decaprenyl-phosphate alpha-N-acetylglucosaminyl 1-phosphate transferase [Prevotellaceae bacterium]|nr:undecaprenyl/decaprenyl-phosphate alpha-N-acetylglucosaminyl 1-phosphate transferase [Prevotellaceae bacterium]
MREIVQEILLHYPAVVIAISFSIGLFFMPFVLKMAIRKQMVVRPNRRTSHHGNVPNVGGINIFSSFLITLLLASPSLSVNSLILAGMYFIFVVGFIDDLLDFSPRKKLLGELIAAFILIVLADIRLTNLHGLLGIYEISEQYIIISYVISAFLFLLIINSLNLIDGVDGLATGIGMVICSFFGIYFQLTGCIELAIMAYSFIGALALFFIYNVFGGRSKIFMGDSGSLVLGFVVYILVVKFCELNIITNQTLPYYICAAPAVAVCVLSVPLIDTLRVMITRIKHGHSPFKADKNHVHHLLLSLGFSHRQVTLILVLVNISFIGLAFIGRCWSNFVLGGIAVLLSIIYTVIVWRILNRRQAKNNLKV